MIRFADFEMSADRRQLCRGGRPLLLRERAFAVLLALIEHAGEVVSKRDLCRRAWPEREVDENNLQVEILGLRKVLGRHAIVTVQGRGYQFALYLETASAPAAPRTEPILIGRDDDVAALEPLLAPGILVTLAGEGGIGKTQLAGALARRRETGLPGSACVAALDAAQDSAQAWRLLAHALQLPPAASPLPAAAVRSALRARSLLLVLDGCEQAVQGVAEMASAILNECPGVSLLATSREVLRLRGERIYRLGPLALASGTGAVATPECDAVRLFRHHASANEAGAAWTRDARAAALAICRQLEGNPLSIKLAARRAGELGLDALLRRLPERLDLLQDAEAGAPSRQRSLRATMDWSYRQLTAGEQRVLRELASLVQPFTLQQLLALQRRAAPAIWDVMEALTGLVDKSLLAIDRSDPPNYRLSGTAMLYARDLRGAKSAKAGTLTITRGPKRARIP